MILNDHLHIPQGVSSRYIIHQGGTGSGKTYSILQQLIVSAALQQNTVTSVVSETMPHLIRGAMRDFKKIVAGEKLGIPVRENKTTHAFTVGNSVIEFFSADDEAKLRGARRDTLFINECNNVSYDAFRQLDVRTRRRTFLDYNPVRRFWVHDELMPALPREDYIFIKSTYRNNRFLGDEEKRNIERHRRNENWWKVYGEGETGVAEGLVFSNWDTAAPVQSVFKARLTGDNIATFLPGDILGYGVDFGYSQSATVIVQVNEYNGELYVHEWFYRTGTQNDQLLRFVKKNLDVRLLAVADSASPQNIDYLMRNGWYGIQPAVKGEGSIVYGLNLLLERKLNVTNQSHNLIRELRGYMWDTDRKGANLNMPVKQDDHAIDAMRYLISYPARKKLLIAGT